MQKHFQRHISENRNESSKERTRHDFQCNLYYYNYYYYYYYCTYRRGGGHNINVMSSIYPAPYHLPAVLSTGNQRGKKPGNNRFQKRTSFLCPTKNRTPSLCPITSGGEVIAVKGCFRTTVYVDADLRARAQEDELVLSEILNETLAAIYGVERRSKKQILMGKIPQIAEKLKEEIDQAKRVIETEQERKQAALQALIEQQYDDRTDLRQWIRECGGKDAFTRAMKTRCSLVATKGGVSVEVAKAAIIKKYPELEVYL